MTETIRPLIAGNWKMNGLKASLRELDAIAKGAGDIGRKADLLICPPATLAGAALVAAGNAFAIGGQDCHAEPSGAHTGDISAEMLADLGAAYVILGHSERRQNHGETNDGVRAKTQGAWRAGLTAIVCIGETQEERNGGQTLDVVGWQLKDSVPDGATVGSTVIAYEPVWAIGTGLTPTPADVADVHRFIRESLETRFGAEGSGIRILYGGSVKPSNAAELLSVAHVNGALVGGASLKAADFFEIAKVYT
jgi:triosephosphate isomerase